MRAKQEYAVYDGDELLVKGGKDWLLEMFGINVYHYCHRAPNKLFDGKYKVINTGKYSGKDIIYIDRLTVTQEREALNQNAIRMMTLHGNLFARDPEEYRKLLSDYGIYYTYRPCSDGVGYILERI